MMIPPSGLPKVYGLLTEELEKVIFSNISNLQNTNIGDNQRFYSWQQ